MSDAGADDPRNRKIFARNLTARAAHEPQGNPPATRPESGPANCFPGYDFDERNLEGGFFPGLRIEFHQGDGAEVASVLPDGPPADAGLSNSDRPLCLWALTGRITTAQLEPEPRSFRFQNLTGLEAWARVHDLMPGRVAILLGREPAKTANPPGAATDALKDAWKDGQFRVERAAGRLIWAVLVADRARYLDEAGVIDPSVYEPGDLTRTLCAPWQFDFRDCGCNYWAAMKPDLVASADGKQPFAFYMRHDRSSSPPVDLSVFDPERKDEFGYAAMVGGAWNSALPVVLNDREVGQPLPVPEPPKLPFMSRREVEEELRYLATVEHALCVQYLYAHYSLNAPAVLPSSPVNDRTGRIFAAASEIFRIAVDEMRHLRWVNEALELLGQKPELGRASSIGRNFHHPFELKPLTREQLEWFIAVEAPSQQTQGVDGMYVRLLASVEHHPHEFDRHASRLVSLFKLIIDEGNDHYERFLAVRRHLDGMKPADYLRPLATTAPKSGTFIDELLERSDAMYRELLSTLVVTMESGDRTGGTFLEQSRRSMRSLHELNHLVAAKGYGPRFTLPPEVYQPLPPGPPPSPSDVRFQDLLLRLVTSLTRLFPGPTRRR